MYGGIITHSFITCKLHLKQSGKVPQPVFPEKFWGELIWYDIYIYIYIYKMSCILQGQENIDIYSTYHPFRPAVGLKYFPVHCAHL